MVIDMKYKYKYEFEADESFEKGCCFDCPLSIMDDSGDVLCPFYARRDECPLEKVNE
jgi:hypothetical protein